MLQYPSSSHSISWNDPNLLRQCCERNGGANFATSRPVATSLHYAPLTAAGGRARCPRAARGQPLRRRARPAPPPPTPGAGDDDAQRLLAPGLKRADRVRHHAIGAVDVETAGSDMGQLRVTCGALLAACGPRPCQHLVRNLRPASGRSTTPCDRRACRLGLGERRRWVFATSSASSAEIRGRHAEHARERHGRTRDCRSPPQNAVRRFPGGLCRPAQARQGPNEAGAARAAG